jgi:copper chaperone
MNTTTYTVSGMTCGHCVGAVTKELSALPGVREVQVQLVPDAASSVAVISDEPLAVDAVREAIDEAGYELVGAV